MSEDTREVPTMEGLLLRNMDTGHNDIIKLLQQIMRIV